VTPTQLFSATHGARSVAFRVPSFARLATVYVSWLVLACGCAIPNTQVVLENDYPASGKSSLVLYEAHWQEVTFQTPLLPGASSGPQSTVAASANTAYALLAPDWDPTESTPPTSLIVIESRAGFSVDLGDTVTIPVDDSTFIGNCAAGGFLTQAQADVVTKQVFPAVFVGKDYEAATCTTKQAARGDARP
jgi:hypothetical protein